MRDLRLLCGAVLLSALGDFVALIPLALHVESTTGSGLAVAGLFIALWFPQALLAGVAGVVVDRFETRRVLLAVSLAQAAVAVALAFAGPLWAVLVLTALLGSLAAVSHPAEFALVPAIAGPGGVGRADGRIETARYLGFTLGPLLGGLLAASGGVEVALLVDAATFLGVAGAAWLLHARRRPAAATGEDSSTPEKLRARDGLAVLMRDRGLALVTCVLVGALAVMTATATAELFFAVDVLEAGETGYGALLAGWTLGMAFGANVLAPRVRAAALLTAPLGGLAVQGLGIALPTLWLHFAFAVTTFSLGGVAHGFKNTTMRRLVHERVPDRMHGRAFAAYNGMRNGAELAALAGGGLAVAAFGARWTLLVAGLLPAAVAAVALVHARRRPAPAAPAAPEPLPATAAG